MPIVVNPAIVLFGARQDQAQDPKHDWIANDCDFVDCDHPVWVPLDAHDDAVELYMSLSEFDRSVTDLITVCAVHWRDIQVDDARSWIGWAAIQRENRRRADITDGIVTGRDLIGLDEVTGILRSAREAR